MNKPVSFPIAKLVRLKGFDEECNEKYIAKCLWQKPNSREKYKNSDIHKSSSDASAPTIADVVMWLYEKHKIWISVDPENDINDTWFHTITNGKSITAFGSYSTLTEAYEKGIKHILNEMI